MLTVQLKPGDWVSIVNFAVLTAWCFTGATVEDRRRSTRPSRTSSRRPHGRQRSIKGRPTDRAGSSFIEGGLNRVILATVGDLKVASPVRRS